jgi:plasmid maintenance system antidote protein VapI
MTGQEGRATPAPRSKSPDTVLPGDVVIPSSGPYAKIQCRVVDVLRPRPSQYDLKIVPTMPLAKVWSVRSSMRVRVVPPDPLAFDPDWCVAPGETLREWIEESGLSVRSTATICGRMPVERMEAIIAGDEPITDVDAEALAHGTGIPDRHWLALERFYRQGLAEGRKRL